MTRKTKQTLLCFSLIPSDSPLLHTAITTNARARGARGRVQVRFASRQNKAGASQRAREGGSERASERCMLHEWVPLHRTAGRTLHPPAPWCPCGCADRRGTVEEPAADEPRTVNTSRRRYMTDSSHQEQHDRIRNGECRLQWAGRGAWHTATLWPLWYSFFIHRWTPRCTRGGLCFSQDRQVVYSGTLPHSLVHTGRKKNRKTSTYARLAVHSL